MERENISEKIDGEDEEKGNNSVEIKVLFFARARDLTGVPEMQLAVSAGSTAHDCLNKLMIKYPNLEEIRSCMVLALNEEYTPDSAVVKNRDELAIIPPISGGYVHNFMEFVIPLNESLDDSIHPSTSLSMEFSNLSEDETADDAGGSPSNNLILDLTGCQLRDLDSVELPPSLMELDLTANRLSALDPRISNLSNLLKLSLRQNLFNDDGVRPLSSWHSISRLQELVLRDNQLKQIPDACLFKMLLVFDVSFNEISTLNGLSRVSNTLKELYVSKNEVTKMEEIEHFHELQILELGSNKLRVMENLQNLSTLQELWLGRNRIRAINLCGLKCITKLSLQSNRLTSMTGLEECVALEELYLSHNGISKMEGLSTLSNLRVLDLSSNKLREINDIENLAKLEDLWLNDNQIASLHDIAVVICGAKDNITTIYLERNPCASLPDYISTLRHAFPNIQQVDSQMFA